MLSIDKAGLAFSVYIQLCYLRCCLKSQTTNLKNHRFFSSSALDVDAGKYCFFQKKIFKFFFRVNFFYLMNSEIYWNQISFYLCNYPEKKIKIFGKCRVKPKRYGRQAICILSAQNKRSNGNNWTLFRKTPKRLLIVHMPSVGAMMKLCMYNSVWQEEFKWGWLTFFTYLKSWNNSLRKDIFLVKQNCAYFSKDISISLHLVYCQSLALQGFLAISSLNWSCDTRLFSQTTLALKS